MSKRRVADTKTISRSRPKKTDFAKRINSALRRQHTKTKFRSPHGR